MPQSIQISSNIDLIPQHNVNLTSDHPNLNSHDYPAINQYNPITHAVTANVDKPKTLQQIQLESKSSSKLIAKERLLQKLKNKLQKMRQIRESQERSNKPSVVQLNVPLTQEQLNLLPSMNVPSTSQHLNVQQHLQDSSDDGEYDNLPELLEITDCLNEDELEFIMNNRIRNAPQNSLNCDEMINKLERLLIKISGMEQNLHTLDSNDYVQQGQEDIISINDPLPSNFGFSNLEEVLKTVTMNAEQNKQMVTNPEIRNNEEQTKNSHRRHKRQRQDDKNQVRIFRVRDGGNSADNPQNSEHIIVVPFPNQANNPQFVPMPVQDINENQSSIQQPEKPHYIVNDQNQNNPQVADSNRSHRAYTFIEHEDEVLIIENNPPRMLSSDGNYMNRGENPNSSRNPSIHSFEHHNPEVQQPSSNLQQMMVNPQHFSQDSQIQVQRDSVIAVPYQNIEKNDPLSQQQRQHRRSTQKQTHQKRHMAKIGQMARNAAQSSERVILESQMFRQYVSQELSRVSKEHQDLGQHNLVSNQQLQEMQQMQQIIASSQQNLASSQQNMSSRQHHKTSRQQHPSQISSQPIPNLNLPNLDSIYQNLYLSHQQQASSQQQQALISQNPKSHFRNVASSQQNLPSYQLALNQQNLTSIPNHVPSSSQNITPSLQNLAANQLNVASIQEHLTQRQQHLISSQQHLISSQRHHKRNQKSQIVQRTITSDQLLEIMTQEHQKADHMLQMYMKHQSMSSQEPQSCSTHENQTNSQNLMNIEKPTSNSGVTVLSCERINPEIDYFNHQNVVVPNSQQISANTQTINPSNSQVNQYYQPNHPEVSPAHQNPTNSSKSVQHTLQPPDSMSYSESLRVIAQNIQNNKSMLDLASLIDRQVDVIVLDDSLEEDKAKEAEDEVPNDQQSLLLEQEEVAKMLRSISAEQQLTMTPPLVTNEDVVPPLIPLQAVMPMQMEPKEDSYVELSKSHDEDGKDDKYHQYVASQDEIQRPVPQLAVIPDNHRQIDQGFMLNAFEPVKYVPIVDVDLSGVLNDMTVPTQPSPEKKKRGRPAKPKEIKIPKKRGRKPGSNVRKIPTFAHKPLQKVYSSLSAMMADRQRMKYDKYKDGSQHTQPSLMLRPAIAENVKKEAEVVIHSDLTELGTADDNSNIDPIAVTKSDPSEDIDDRLEAPEDIDDSLEVCSLAETEKLSDSDEEDDEIEYKIDVEDNTAEFKESVPNDQTEPIDQPKMNNLFEITEPKIEFESKEDQEVSKTNVDRDNNKDMLRVPITIHKSNSIPAIPEEHKFEVMDQY
ncbi:myb-like protein AA [Chironomus tepperi]|uniref:myb-like protein AA n=1 Tax=Chironomus tepperi TaxID=113505 RepID=UPI00391FC071